MAQGLHSAAFTPVQRSRKVQDSFTIGKQMSKPLLSFLFKSARARTHTLTLMHARGCHRIGICNKPSHPRFQLPVQQATLFFLILKKIIPNKNHLLKEQQQKTPKNTKSGEKRINGIFNLGDVILETQLFLFSKQTLQDSAGKQDIVYILKNQEPLITYKVPSMVFATFARF